MKDALVEQMRDIAAQSIELNARIDALTVMVGALLQRMNLPAGYLNAQIDSIAQAVHQKRLERLETIDPAGISFIDKRTPQDLEEMYLDALDAIRFIEEK
jgi:outer membrane murein-binding lipoprotein Lpp